MSFLTQDQKDRVWRDGVLVIEDAVTGDQLAKLRAKFAHWVEDSKTHDGDYGETLDGRARFDVQPGHSAEKPALRRVQLPEDAIELSPNHLPSTLTHDVVRGEAGGRVRGTPFDMALPAAAKGTSFFAQQEGADAG